MTALAAVLAAVALPMVAPAPQQMELDVATRVSLAPDRTVALRVARDVEAAQDWAARNLKFWFGDKAPSVKAALSDAPDIPSPEGYALTADEGGVAIRAHGLKGVRLALYTLRQLAVPARGTLTVTHYELPKAAIRDWPRYAFRGIHLEVPSAPDFSEWELERLIRLAAYYKYNYAVLEPWGSYASERYPFVGGPHAFLNRAVIRRLCALGDELGIRLLPQWNVFGHATLEPAQGGHEILVPHPEYAPLFEPLGGWNWCLTNPEAKKTLAGLVEEMIDWFDNPPYVHIGCDEAEPPSCADCMKADYPKLFVDHIRTLHDVIARHGAKTMMWHDMLLDAADPRWKGFKRNGDAAFAKAAEEGLPRDIVICEWYYSMPRDDGEFPTIRHFRELGFPLLFCPWEGVVTGRAASQFGQKVGMDGFLQTVWHRCYGKYTPSIFANGSFNGWGTEVGEFLSSNALRFKTHWRDICRDMGLTDREKVTLFKRGWNNDR